MPINRIHGQLRTWIAKAPGVTAGLVLFAVLTAVRAPVLTTPPHWDAILGPFAEAAWLKSNHFDYAQLLYHELRFERGGPATYVWSVVPTVYAALMTCLQPTTVFFVLHLLNLLLAATIAVLLYRLLRGPAGCPPAVAVTAAAAMLAQPIFGGQVDAINMEIPVTAAILLSVRAMVAHRYWRASGWSLAALFIKDAALLVCVANLIYVVLLVCAKKIRSPKAVLASCLLPILLRFAIVSHVFSATDLGTSPQPLGFLKKAGFLQIQLTRCVPDLMLLYLAALCLALVHAWRLGLLRLPRRPTEIPQLAANALRAFGGVYIHALLTATVFVVFYLVMLEPLPRYFTWYMPSLILAFTIGLHRLAPAAKWQPAVLGGSAVIWLMNAYGALFPKLPWYYARSGELLERSREYILDLRSNQTVARFLEQHVPDAPIVTTCPMDRILTMPELGYVTRPLNVYTVWTRPTYAPVKSCETLTRDHFGKIVVVYKPTVFGYGNPELNLEPRPFDQILFTDRVRGASTIVYRLQKPPGSS